jgi:hypothetical protein
VTSFAVVCGDPQQGSVSVTGGVPPRQISVLDDCVSQGHSLAAGVLKAPDRLDLSSHIPSDADNQTSISCDVGTRPALFTSPSTMIAGVATTPSLSISFTSKTFSTVASTVDWATMSRTVSASLAHVAQPVPTI